MKYGAKKDANHKEIANALTAVGVPVYDLSGAGCGIPDCLVWVWDSWQLVEIKNTKTAYGKRGLNPIQKKWLTHWRGGPVHILKTVEQALEFASGDLKNVEIFYGDQSTIRPTDTPSRFLKFQSTEDKDLPF